MTIPLACLLIGALLPYVWAGASVPFRNRQFGSLDLRQPRAQGEMLTEGGARAVGAQGNAWEALALFAAGNLAAFMAAVEPIGTWTTLSLVWVVARIAHGVFYISDVPVLRVAGFLIGFWCSVGLFILALMNLS